MIDINIKKDIFCVLRSQNRRLGQTEGDGEVRIGEGGRGYERVGEIRGGKERGGRWSMEN